MHGIVKGTRLALLVRPGIDFVSLVFALLKAGAVSILIDPGMGRGNLIRCLAEAEPEGFIAVPLVHAVRVFLRRRFARAKFNVTVGRRWFWGGATLEQLRVQKGACPDFRVNENGTVPFRLDSEKGTGLLTKGGLSPFLPLFPPWPMIRRRSSLPPAAPVRQRACFLHTAIFKPK